MPNTPFVDMVEVHGGISGGVAACAQEKDYSITFLPHTKHYNFEVNEIQQIKCNTAM